MSHPRFNPRTITISIHALHEESDAELLGLRCHGVISIHALHEESDRGLRRIRTVRSPFQSTLSMRRATYLFDPMNRQYLFQSTLSMRRATVQLDIFVRFLRRKPAA